MTPPLSVSVAREIAYDTFVAVLKDKQKPEILLEDKYKLPSQNLRRLDKNFIKEMLYGGLRWYSKLYWILQNTSKRELDKCSDQVVAALVLGTYQIYYMDKVPDRAAVNESVEYVRAKGQAAACSFVNGILRQIARRAQYFKKPDKLEQPAEYLALQYAHPKWIVDRWLPQFSFDKLEKILAANNRPPPYSMRINSQRTPLKDATSLQQQLLKQEKTHSERRPLRSALRLVEPPFFGTDSLFQKGLYTVQDEASQLVGYLVAPQQGQTVVDACAGPGGKLSHIYEMGDEQIALFAIEKNHRQMEKARETMTRMGFNKLEWLAEDFNAWQSAEKVDKILLDAPCSGFGVLRRHPEGKWQKSLAGIKRLAGEQARMIEHAIRQIKTGGELIFSVCSYEREESIKHLRYLLKAYPDHIAVVDPGPRLPDYYRKYITREGLLAIYPGNPDEMDGFSAFVVTITAEFPAKKTAASPAAGSADP